MRRRPAIRDPRSIRLGGDSRYRLVGHVQALIEALRERRREPWLAENRAAIRAYKDRMEKHGVFSDGLRTF